MTQQRDTIAAIATAPGRGGVGIVRVSGPLVPALAQQICQQRPKPRYAHHCVFQDTQGQPIDEGIALYFAAPASFTGEHVLELQAHGGPVVLNALLESVLARSVRLAQPGEFSQRAFLNNKIDLAQAEAIADLIDASSQQAARSALRSLQGEFSAGIHALRDQLVALRKFVEAAIDFPDEDIEFIQGAKVTEDLAAIKQRLATITQTAHQGVLLRDGMTVVIAGRPNAGKSSLLNALCNKESAIVTDIAGTTRDVLREFIHIDGMPLHIIDTAGIRDTQDPIEQEGVKRAQAALAQADVVLWIMDLTQGDSREDQQQHPLVQRAPGARLLRVFNKADLVAAVPPNTVDTYYLSAKHGDGVEELKAGLKAHMGYQHDQGAFIARSRHLQALRDTQQCIEHGLAAFAQHQAGELLAEDLRQAQQALNGITGEFTSDDLLGEIFSSFCIGK